jgi:hypothetical protein
MKRMRWGPRRMGLRRLDVWRHAGWRRGGTGRTREIDTHPIRKRPFSHKSKGERQKVFWLKDIFNRVTHAFLRR